MTDAGRSFYVTTYFIEGGDPMISGVNIILEDFDSRVMTGPTVAESSRTRQQCRKYALLVKLFKEDALKLLALIRV